MWRDQLASIPNVHARQAELERLAQTSGPALLISSFADPYGPLRLRAAELLSEAMSPALSQQIVRAIVDCELGLQDEPTARSAACLSLAAPNVSPEACEFLLQALQDASAEVQYHAVLALSKAGTDLDFSAAIQAILTSTADPGLIVVAAQVASFRGWTKLASAIVKTRAKVRAHDRFQVDLCLGELATAGAPIEPRLRGEIIADIRKALGKEETMAAAINGLIAWADTDSIPHIIKAAGKWRVHPLLKVDASRALYLLGDKRGVVQLAKHLRSKRVDVRGYTIDLTGQLPIPELFESVAAIANSQDPLADQAVEALARFGKRGAKVLKAVAASHPDSQLRELAASYVG